MGVPVFGGTGNKYDDDRCGTSDGTLGNASKISRSKGLSFLDDADLGLIERSEPGVSGMIGGSMGDRSGIASSGNVNGKSVLLNYVTRTRWPTRVVKHRFRLGRSVKEALCEGARPGNAATRRKAQGSGATVTLSTLVTAHREHATYAHSVIAVSLGSLLHCQVKRRRWRSSD